MNFRINLNFSLVQNLKTCAENWKDYDSHKKLLRYMLLVCQMTLNQGHYFR